MQEFAVDALNGSDQAPAELVIKTNRFHGDGNTSPVDQIKSAVFSVLAPGHQSPPIFVVDAHIDSIAMPALYRSSNCFVLPSRGEGWGRPHVEAMAMGVPVIATNWSGPTAFLTEENGWPLAIDGLVPVSVGPFRKHHRWAEPSVSHLRMLLRHAAENPSEAAVKGARAREDVVRRFSLMKVGGIVADRIALIEAKLNEEGSL